MTQRIIIKNSKQNKYICISLERIFFLDTDDEVDDSALVSKPGVMGYEPIEVKIFDDPESIEVKTPDGRSFFFDFDPGDFQCIKGYVITYHWNLVEEIRRKLLTFPRYYWQVTRVGIHLHFHN